MIEIVVENKRVSIKHGREELSVGQTYPAGFGSIQLRDTPRNGLHVVKLTCNGNYVYSLRLICDGTYRIGPRFGHRVVDPAEEPDPIRRVLREYDVPVTNLVRVNHEFIKIGEAHYPVEADYVRLPNAYHGHFWVTDGVLEGNVITGAGYAISFNHARVNSEKKPNKVLVWPNCDTERLRQDLAKGYTS